VIDANISDREKLCVRILAKLFDQENALLIEPRERLRDEGLKTEQTEYERLMQMMEAYGVICNPIHALSRYTAFTISPNSVRYARELDSLERKSQEPEDIVGQVNQQVRKHPVAAWVVIGFVVLAAVLTVVSQVLNILNTLGMLPVKHP
jgi:hypothetical protein